MQLWYKKGLQNLLSSGSSPLTTLFDNPMFPQGMGTPTLGVLPRRALPVAHSFIHSGTGQSDVPMGGGDWLTAIHISSLSKGHRLYRQDPATGSPSCIYPHLLNTYTLPPKYTALTLNLKNSLSEAPRHLLSSLYNLLQALAHDHLPPYTRMWSRTWVRTSPDRTGRLHSILPISQQYLAILRKRTTRFCPGGTGTPPHYINIVV